MGRNIVALSLILCIGILIVPSSGVRKNCSCKTSFKSWQGPCILESLQDGQFSSTVMNTLNDLFAERKSPDESVLASSADPNVYFSEAGTITITFYHEGAGYRNQMGYYLFNSTHNLIPGSEEMVLPDVSFWKPGCMEKGDTVVLGPFEAGTQLGWWIKPNGYNGGITKNGETVKFYSGMDWVNMNPDEKRHVVMVYSEVEQQMLVGFEDLYNLGDRDYNDVMFTVIPEKSTTLDLTGSVKLSGERLIQDEPAGAEPTGTQLLSRAGFQYATVDVADITSQEVGCSSSWRQLPSGWTLAQPTQSTFAAMVRRPWATEQLVLADGWGYQPGQCRKTSDTVPGSSSPMLSTLGSGAVGVGGCDARVAMHKTASGFGSNLLQNRCNSGSADQGDWITPSTDGSVTFSATGGHNNCQMWCRTLPKGTKAKKDGVTLMISQTIELGTTAGEPYRHGFGISVWSKADGVDTPSSQEDDRDYAVYIDVEFSDGTPRTTYYRYFPAGSYDWTQRRANIYSPGGNLIRAHIHAVFRRRDGTACFSDWSVTPPDPNVLPNPSFADVYEVKKGDGGKKGDPVGWFSLRNKNKKTYSLQTDNGGFNDATYSAWDTDMTVLCVGDGCGKEHKNTFGAMHNINFVEHGLSGAVALRFGGYSKADNINSGENREDYSIYLDIQYTDDSWSRAVSTPFRAGTHDWELSQEVFPVSKAIKQVNVACLLRNHDTGTAYFDRVFVDPIFESSTTTARQLGATYGDPHMVSFDGISYDMQGVGEYVLVRDLSVSDPGFDVQIRTAAAGNNRASLVAAAVVAAGCSSIEVSRNSGTNQPTIRIQGGVARSDFAEGQALKVGGGCDAASGAADAILTRVRNLAADKSSQMVIGEYEVSFPTLGHKVTFTVYQSQFGVQFLQVMIHLPTNSAGMTVGLLGNNNNDGSAGDFVTRGGLVVTDKYVMADSWRISDEESYFSDYAEGESTSTYTDATFHIRAQSLMESASSAEKETAAEACAGVGNEAAYESCYTDVLATGDVSLASSTAHSGSYLGNKNSLIEEETTAITDDTPSTGSTGGDIGVIAAILTTLMLMGVFVGIVGLLCLGMGGCTVWRMIKTQRHINASKHDLEAFPLSSIPHNLLQNTVSLSVDPTPDDETFYGDGLLNRTFSSAAKKAILQVVRNDSFGVEESRKLTEECSEGSSADVKGPAPGTVELSNQLSDKTTGHRQRFARNSSATDMRYTPEAMEKAQWERKLLDPVNDFNAPARPKRRRHYSAMGIIRSTPTLKVGRSSSIAALRRKTSMEDTNPPPRRASIGTMGRRRASVTPLADADVCAEGNVINSNDIVVHIDPSSAAQRLESAPRGSISTTPAHNRGSSDLARSGLQRMSISPKGDHEVKNGALEGLLIPTDGMDSPSEHGRKAKRRHSSELL